MDVYDKHWRAFVGSNNESLIQKSLKVQLGLKLPMKTAFMAANLESYSELLASMSRKCSDIFFMHQMLFLHHGKTSTTKHISTRYLLMKNLWKMDYNLFTTLLLFQK